ncbi:MAG: hypothetical protein ACXIUZ_13710, partial [Lysobacteraceae bacterium]
YLQAGLAHGSVMSGVALLAVLFSGFQLILLRGDLITAAVIFTPILIFVAVLSKMAAVRLYAK